MEISGMIWSKEAPCVSLHSAAQLATHSLCLLTVARSPRPGRTLGSALECLVHLCDV